MKSSKALQSARKLAYDMYHVKGDSKKISIKSSETIVFLHGILGSKQNWRTPANSFLKMHPNFRCIAVDLRGHGESQQGFTGPHTVTSCAHDLLELVEDPLADFSVPTILSAHSFGGKVALRFLEELHASGKDLPLHSWILDSIPGPYDINKQQNDGESVVKVLKALETLPKTFSSREVAINAIVKAGIDVPVAKWLAMNIVLDPQEKVYKWSMKLDTIRELFEDFRQEDLWGFLESYDGENKIHFVRAGRNSMWTPDVLKKFEYITKNNDKIRLHTMDHVGHWLHVEDLSGLLSIMTESSGLLLPEREKSD